MVCLLRVMLFQSLLAFYNFYQIWLNVQFYFVQEINCSYETTKSQHVWSLECVRYSPGTWKQSSSRHTTWDDEMHWSYLQSRQSAWFFLDFHSHFSDVISKLMLHSQTLRSLSWAQSSELLFSAFNCLEAIKKMLTCISVEIYRQCSTFAPSISSNMTWYILIEVGFL